MVDESVKFAWAYLILYGVQTNGTWCHYGGRWEPVKDANKYPSWEEAQAARKEIQDAVLSLGIDWKKTDIPSVSEESSFNDTESPSSDKLATLGTLVLNNGTTYKLGSSDNQAAHLAEAARKMINKLSSDIQMLADRL